ncbi:Cys-tRNA(Pro) deacylase [Mangrovibacterium marinum]|uniref:Cys-tRNA(Pro)/Cys-tRNA(Cys) deacylase n=1 Tax=Mangrovibacterium marinum TaxID=1639118 RepID=A0A2T5C5V4_9BACT|nr:Cys-tRNA(Pro) deacylase [Mangrovibacterium marinum]PTN10261.1 Cys-tRNA(Pro)/Cys-tRNA(Cys) deacylase [Mangrovibacterium marinum]
MKTPAKTNASRLLDKQKIAYELFAYEVDETDLSAASLAAKLGQNVKQIFKTLVLRGTNTGIFVCVIPGDEEVDLKLAAKVSGNKKAELIAMKELLPVTGYIRGGCTPIGMKKQFPVFIHDSCLMFDKIYISGGKRGLQLKLSPQDIIAASKANLAKLVVS